MRLSPERIAVHESARTAYQIWQQLRSDTVAINYKSLTGYYQQPIRLIEMRHKTSGRYHYLFFERFGDIHRIQMIQSQQRQPSYIYQDNKKAVQTLAWAEVLKLANQKNTHHPTLFKSLKDNAPRAIILGLMQKKTIKRKKLL